LNFMIIFYSKSVDWQEIESIVAPMWNKYIKKYFILIDN